jgi:hypothetical protein
MVRPPTHEEFAGLGFSINPVRGARCFGVTEDGRLTGVIFKQAIWRAGVNTAGCLTYPGFAMTHRVGSSYQVPPAHEFAACHCGFYAYADGSNDYNDNPRDVQGVIEGTGETVVGSRGFRTMKARILALAVPEGLVADFGVKVRERYGSVPFFPSFETMINEFPPELGWS